MFISQAFAMGTQPGGEGGDPFGFLLPMVLIFGVFYFLLIRPQQQRAKQHKSMIASLRRGDRVVTGGGIIGTVSKVVSDTEVMVEIAEEVKVRIERSTLTSVLSKTEPAQGAGAPGGGGGPEDTSITGRLLKGLMGRK